MSSFWYLIFRYGSLLFISGILFSSIPKLTYAQIEKLLVYHDYKNEILKKRFTKVIRVYLILGLALGFVFVFLLSPIQISNNEGVPNIGITLSSHPELFALSFGLSFLLVIILRISTLLNKTKILSYILTKNQKLNMEEKSLKYNYRGLREEVKSFLFSIFLSALLGITILFCYNLIFKPNDFINFNLSISYQNLLYYILFIAGFSLFFAFITFLGEVLLSRFGVHPKCIDEVKE